VTLRMSSGNVSESVWWDVEPELQFRRIARLYDQFLSGST
jgi:hypothetical protein